MSIATAGANAVLLAAAAPARARFAAAVRDPAAMQAGILDRLLRDGERSAYGRSHGFARIRSAAEFAERVPLVDFDGLAPWMERVARGENTVLTGTPVRFLEPTGGSSGYLKLIPYTAALASEFSAATLPWLFDLFASRPALARGSAYWAVTPPGRAAKRTDGGVAIGMQDDADYFPAPLRSLLRRSLAVPAAVSLAGDIASCRYLTLLALLGATDLTLISVWSPSFLTLLASALDEEWELLLHDLERGTVSGHVQSAPAARMRLELPPCPRRARALRARFGGRAPENLESIWTHLALISCWTEGHASHALQGGRERFPSVEIQGKGLLATEGVVSIPLFGAQAPVAAVASHYLELLDPRDGRAIPIHVADVGGTYEVALSTGGGLYRYRLHDLVRVEGMLHRTPLLSFRGRADGASDLAGEKLTPALAERAISDAIRATGLRVPFAMLVPSQTPAPHYRLYVEAEPHHAGILATSVDRVLQRAHHYALCRSLGQLGPIRGVSVRDGYRLYEQACAERGQRTGAIKPPALECRPGLDHVFTEESELVLQ